MNLISLPILISWGLPISLLSPIGNLIFSPLMTLFMFVSCIIFFTELVGISNYFLIKILEKLTLFWTYILDFASHKYLIYFPKPPLLLTIFLVFLILFILWFKNLTSFKRIFIFFSLICLLHSLLNNFLIEKNFSIEIVCSRSKVDLLKFANKISLIDSGVLSKFKGFKSWADYVLLPKLIQNSGSNKINYLVINRVTDSTLINLEHFLSKVYVGMVVVENKKLLRDIKFQNSLNSKIKFYFKHN
ncbi:hypothetical protein M1446_05805 [Candidatus Dependentiae bacterium]|nr:hypothetical protein [Candidatus Dependentiae bacterium]